MTGIEPVTPSLPRKCSTSEPHQHSEIVRALYRSQLIILTEEEWIVNIFIDKFLKKFGEPVFKFFRRFSHKNF